MPSRSNSAMGGSNRSQTPRPNIYATVHVPAGVTCPQPMGTNACGTSFRVPLPASVNSYSPGHGRSVSFNRGQSPAFLGRTNTLPSRAVTPKPPNSSLGSGKSYSRYDPAISTLHTSRAIITVVIRSLMLIHLLMPMVRGRLLVFRTLLRLAFRKQLYQFDNLFLTLTGLSCGDTLNLSILFGLPL